MNEDLPQRNRWRHVALSVGWLAGLIVVIWVTGAACTAIALRLNPDEPKVPVMLGMKGEDFDILYFGNSHTQNSFNPLIIDEVCGARSYNFGVGSGSFTQAEFLLRRYLMNNEKPRLVVVGLSVNREATSEKIRPSIYLGLDAEERAVYLEYCREHDIEFGWFERNLIRLGAYRHRRALENFVKYLIQGEKRVPKYNRGQLAIDISAPLPRRMPTHTAGLNEGTLGRLVSFCRQQGLPVVLVEPPTSRPYNVATRGREEVLRKIDELRRRSRQEPFVSFNQREPPIVSDDGWLSPDHVNAKGAEQFSRAVAPFLAEVLQRKT